nr:reverse transcriptase domain-containing protein [Tanacetum cinerariifolium]
MDYFTKWVEAKAVATITGRQVKRFVWDKIVCRFGIPGKIISDNGKQFADNPFKDCLGEGIKARLGEGNKNWVEELPHVLWAHRTMIKSSHGDTPFSLTYGTEAVIPAEIEMPTYRTAAVNVANNDRELRLNLDLLEERRERAVICEARAKSKMMKYYNARVRGVAFQPGDFVYRSNDASHAVAGGKLGPKWEGPYEVTEVLGNGAYKLRSTDGTVLPRTWNVTNLKRLIPAEIGMPTYRTTAVDVVNNDKELRLNMDLLEERRELAAINEARSKSKMTKYYNSRVRGVAFQPGNLVYRSNDVSHAAAGGKLGPKWEGPYEVTDALGNRAYKLRSMDGTILSRTWNVANLKRCYL